MPGGLIAVLDHGRGGALLERRVSIRCVAGNDVSWERRRDPVAEIGLLAGHFGRDLHGSLGLLNLTRSPQPLRAVADLLNLTLFLG